MKIFTVPAIAAALFAALSFGLLYCAEPANDNPEYKLQPTDVINITVHGQPDLTTKTRITADGYITFPLLGKVKVQDITVRELEQKLKELLEKDYLVNAQVVIFIEEYRSRQVSVIGEVNNPGKYDIPDEREITIMQAIAMAGGFTKHADTTKTKVMRSEGGEKKNIVVNAKDITEKGEKDKDVGLKADDIVVVPESFF
ncbi:MAG: polysaccharide export protein [Candidatus Omnitrophica bacterium]|nr:polysaccharide export protein [Candidatus Omnitrophota bacterium]